MRIALADPGPAGAAPFMTPIHTRWMDSEFAAALADTIHVCRLTRRRPRRVLKVTSPGGAVAALAAASRRLERALSPMLSHILLTGPASSWAAPGRLQAAAPDDGRCFRRPLGTHRHGVWAARPASPRAGPRPPGPGRTSFQCEWPLEWPGPGLNLKLSSAGEQPEFKLGAGTWWFAS